MSYNLRDPNLCFQAQKKGIFFHNMSTLSFVFFKKPALCRFYHLRYQSSDVCLCQNICLTSCFLSSARCILFLIIWLVTGGRHHFWFLPNLTADVGFIDSFRPLYTHEYKGPRSGDKKGSDKTDDKDSSASAKAQKSDSDDKSDSEKKDADDEEEDEEEENKEVGRGESKEAEGEGTEERQSDTDSDRREDEGSQHSNGNDFEMITREELEQHTEEEEDEEEEEEDDEDDEETQKRKEEGGSETKPQTAET